MSSPNSNYYQSPSLTLYALIFVAVGITIVCVVRLCSGWFHERNEEHRGRGLTRSRSLPPYLSPPPLYSAPDRVSRTILPVEVTFLRYFTDLPLFLGFPSIARFYFIRRNGGTFLSSASAFDPSRGGNDWARLYPGSGRRSGGRDYIDPGERPEIWDAALPNVAVSSTEKEKKGEMAGWVEVASEKAKANDSATPWWMSPNNTLVSLFRFSLSLACLLFLALRREGSGGLWEAFLVWPALSRTRPAGGMRPRFSDHSRKDRQRSPILAALSSSASGDTVALSLKPGPRGRFHAFPPLSHLAFHIDSPLTPRPTASVCFDHQFDHQPLERRLQLARLLRTYHAALLPHRRRPAFILRAAPLYCPLGLHPFPRATKAYEPTTVALDVGWRGRGGREGLTRDPDRRRDGRDRLARWKAAGGRCVERDSEGACRSREREEEGVGEDVMRFSPSSLFVLSHLVFYLVMYQ